MTKIVPLLLLITLASGLIGCGQKGPLKRQETGNPAVVMAVKAPQLPLR